MRTQFVNSGEIFKWVNLANKNSHKYREDYTTKYHKNTYKNSVAAIIPNLKERITQIIVVKYFQWKSKY